MANLKPRRLRDRKFGSKPRKKRFTYAWLVDQPNFTLIYTALDTAQRNFHAASMHPGNGTWLAPNRQYSDRLQRRYAEIMKHLKAMLRA